MEDCQLVRGNIVDAINKKIFPGEIVLKNGKISEIRQVSEKFNEYIMPGFVDSHVHIESSMLVPSEFARLAVVHGTVAAVSDPHEIANVFGVDGINIMIKNGAKTPFKFFFGAPSCVPATNYETSGGVVGVREIEELMSRDDIWLLSEMMNYPGVIAGEEEVLKKIQAAKRYNKRIDGHAPGLRGEDLKKYLFTGITTDHESSHFEEAEEKIKNGMLIQIREGSAAKNFGELYPLINKYPGKVMLCTDDCHPEDLLNGHINSIISKGISKGIDLFDILQAATVNPVMHYKLPVGLLRTGDNGDLIITDNLKSFKPKAVYINGRRIFSNSEVLFKKSSIDISGNFRTEPIDADDIKIRPGKGKMKVIVAQDKQLYTKVLKAEPKTENGYVVQDQEQDISKIVVVNKYRDAKCAIGFVRGFGVKDGAIAGSVAHDSHNIIGLGTKDEYIVKSINEILKNGGGIAAVSKNRTEFIPLEVGGLMTNRDGK